MTRIPLPMLLALPLTLVFSIGALVLAGDNHGPGNLAVSPFGWNRVVVTHALTTLPLSWILAVAATRAWPILRRPWTVFLWAIAGLDIAGLTIFAGNFVAHELSVLDAGHAVRLTVRITWCLLLQLPWCLAGRTLLRVESGNPTDGNVHSLKPRTIINFICWSLVVAVFIPLSFVNGLTARQTQLAHEHWKSFRIEQARQVVRRLCGVGSIQSLGNSGNTIVNKDSKKPTPREILPKQAQAMLSENVAFLTSQIKALLADEPTDARQLLLGKYYAALDRPAQARQTLEPLANINAEAAAALGELHQRQGHWQSANDWFSKAIELARNENPKIPQTVADREKLLSIAYDSLARGARELKQYDQAEVFYREAITHLPALEAHFQAQLAQHCDLGGRPVEAIEHQRKAHELASDKHAAPPSLAVKILSNSTPVGIFAPAASNND